SSQPVRILPTRALQNDSRVKAGHDPVQRSSRPAESRCKRSHAIQEQNYAATNAPGCRGEPIWAVSSTARIEALSIHTATLSGAVVPVLPAPVAARLLQRTPSLEIPRSTNPGRRNRLALQLARWQRENCFRPIPATNRRRFRA